MLFAKCIETNHSDSISAKLPPSQISAKVQESSRITGYSGQFFVRQNMYRSLSADCTIETLQALRQRIHERFPESGLGNVCHEVQNLARETRERISWSGKRLLWIRIAVACVIGLGIWGGLQAVQHVKLHQELGLEEIDAGTNVIILLGAAIYSLLSLESRIKRHRLLQAIHELRSIAHVVDMHQLTKDPSSMFATAATQTPSSPKRILDPFQLTRYLDYCSEMLSLVGKLAALYAQTSSDSVVLQAVNDIEQLTTSLNRSIWQKIIMLDNDLDLKRHREQLAAIPGPDATS